MNEAEKFNHEQHRIFEANNIKRMEDELDKLMKEYRQTNKVKVLFKATQLTITIENTKDRVKASGLKPPDYYPNAW